MTEQFRRVLVVEDDPTLCQVLERNFTRRGIKLQCSGTVADALRAIGEAAPDLLLLDINLPDRSGWELLRALRAQGIKIPTIIISAARCSPERLAEFKPLAYLPKPFPLDALLRLVMSPTEQPHAV